MSLWTISLVTQILCLALVSAFVALRGVVAWRFKKGVDVEDEMNVLANELIGFCFVSLVYTPPYTTLPISILSIEGERLI
ncbi:hypothetical protein BO79DRAFT_154110 [Aspergillus costaricaensis CBS 115574]|uniref:Uncharacterized protein n=1 Tax=Aspergillus costaricaensis CBS 115574 TaxID=1448317 RepID=A0ACD1I7A6_9EURO|nr:hypothetical protein BO79DRAFT_154110 [Aspergillus costaricaensis CBS 115574]RAK86153.1 hypothetical protein BO79DRAFT_154110 [Aspergillus costaricaensis CBS 115574]